MVPPPAADGGSEDERDHGNDAEDERRGLPAARPLLLFDGEMFLSVQPFAFLGELLLDSNSSPSFLSRVAEQCVSWWRGDEKRRGHEHDANEGFHMEVPFWR